MGPSDGWIRAVAMTDVAQPNSYVTFELDRESYLVLNDGGTVRAFFNVCQHRGHPLCPAGRGEAKLLRCPYHGWTYALDGALHHVPERDTFDSEVETIRLEPVPLRVKAGYVWLDSHAGPAC
jgi:Rieske 2Fe-2S family protein